MKHGGMMLVCLAGSLALGMTATARAAAAADNPYLMIVDRNVFGLKPPPPPPDPGATKLPPPKITLQGFTTFGGIKRVLLKAQMPAKPGEPPKGEQSFILAEGQRDGDIEVLEIDTRAGTVKVNDFGTITSLDFTNNGIKTAAAPGAVPPPGFVAPMKTVMAVPGPVGGGSMGLTPFPTRSLRQSGGGGSVSPQAAGGAGLASVNVGGNSLALSGSGASVDPSVTSQPSGSQLSPEAKLLLYEANRLRNQQAIQAGERRAPLPRSPAAGLFDQGAAPTPTPAPMPPLPPGGPQQFPPPGSY